MLLTQDQDQVIILCWMLSKAVNEILQYSEKVGILVGPFSEYCEIYSDFFFIDIFSVSCDWCCAGGAPGPAAPGRAGHVPDVDQDAGREAGARTLVMLPDTATIWLLHNTLRSDILHLVPCACLPQLLSWLSSQVNRQPKDNRNNLAQI